MKLLLLFLGSVAWYVLGSNIHSILLLLKDLEVISSMGCDVMQGEQAITWPVDLGSLWILREGSERRRKRWYIVQICTVINFLHLFSPHPNDPLKFEIFCMKLWTRWQQPEILEKLETVPTTWLMSVDYGDICAKLIFSPYWTVKEVLGCL